MTILSGFRADQLIGQLVAESDINTPNAQKAVERLKKLGPKMIPRIIEALAMSDKAHTMAFVDILASKVSDKTLPYYKEGLADGGERVVSGTAWALSSSHNYNANSLLDFFDDPEVSKGALIEVLKVHKKDLSCPRVAEPRLRSRAQGNGGTVQDHCGYRRHRHGARPDQPHGRQRPGGQDAPDPAAQQFKGREINNALEMQLGDANKMVRGSALKALGSRDGPINIQRVARLLHDPDLDVQSKAVDVIVKINHPDTIKFIVEALKDESEYTRRSAVESPERNRRCRFGQGPAAGDQG